MVFSEWLRTIRGTEKEAQIEATAMDAEKQREAYEDLMWELHCERNEYAGKMV